MLCLVHFTVVALTHTHTHTKCKSSKKWGLRFILSHSKTYVGSSLYSALHPHSLPPRPHLSTQLLYLNQMAACFCLCCRSAWHPGRLNTVTPQWVAQETGMTTSRHAQRETPEVVTMETPLVVPPLCECDLLLEAMAISCCHVYLHDGLRDDSS